MCFYVAKSGFMWLKVAFMWFKVCTTYVVQSMYYLKDNT